ncbi:hypothetical protein [uncultured Duncaniella sp.]|uniref:hypothetical protein n=1 Tax=uncultured Duncaniella sp. TaxID=2768039 RepID=UPI0025B1B53A|nr:hypothetical protein [uncultured Duncaniella sp.]
MEVDRYMPYRILHIRFHGYIILERCDYFRSASQYRNISGVNKSPFITRRTVGSVLLLPGDIINATAGTPAFSYLAHHTLSGVLR